MSHKRRHSADGVLCRGSPKRICINDNPISPRLTAQNLQTLQAALTDNMPSPATRSGSRSPTKNADARSDGGASASSEIDTPARLRAYGIVIDSQQERPSGLTTFLQDLCEQRPRLSPNAKHITARAGILEEMSEASGRAFIQGLLLLQPSAPLENGMDKIWLSNNANLKRVFLPPLRPEFAAMGISPLSQPQPDACVGYIKWQTAERGKPKLPHAFSADEDVVLAAKYDVAKETHLPFLTCHYKSVARGTSCAEAKPQAARDGAAIACALSTLFRDAYPDQTPDVIDTCHISVTCDMVNFFVYLHWYDGLIYHMQSIEEGMMKKDKDVEDMRRIVRNWADWALGTRLQRIKDALAIIMQSGSRGERVTRAVPTTALPSPAASGVSSATDALAKPSGKRQRTGDNGEQYPMG